MKKIKLSQATWLEINDKRYGPGDVLEAEDSVAAGLISAGSGEEVKENANLDT